MARVVHQGAEVVSREVAARQLAIVVGVGHPMHGDKLLPVGALMLMMQSDPMADLMHDMARLAARIEVHIPRDVPTTSAVPNSRGACKKIVRRSIVSEHHHRAAAQLIGRQLRRQSEAYRRLGVPSRDGGSDVASALTFRDAPVDPIRDGSYRPDGIVRPPAEWLQFEHGKRL